MCRNNPVDEIGCTEDLDQIGNGVGRDARTSIPEHLRETVNCFLLDLNAGFGTLCFRDFIGRLDSLLMSKSPLHHLRPLIVITGKVVQVQLTLLKFGAISSGRWSGWFVTFGDVRWWRWLGMLRRRFGTAMYRLGMGTVLK